jgi:hypothetical protein
MAPQPINPLLANGQIPTRVKINFAGAANGLPNVEDPIVTSHFIGGQLNTGGRLLQEQLVTGNYINQFRQNSLRTTSGDTFGPSTRIFKRQADKKAEKRELVLFNDGTTADEANYEYVFDGLAEFGQPDFKFKLGKQGDLEDEIKEHDREPAEGEVEAVMNICSNCSPEPFEKAVVLSWKSLSAEVNNVIGAKAATVCGDF